MGKTLRDIGATILGSVILLAVLSVFASSGLMHLHRSFPRVPGLSPADLAWGSLAALSLRWAWLFIHWLERRVSE